MSWYDFKIGEAPVPCVGRLLIEGTPTPGLWDRIRAEAATLSPRGAVTYGATFLIQIDNVPAFLSMMPPDMQPPTQQHPTSGLPRNVWIGGRMKDVWPEILDVHTAVRFLLPSTLMEFSRGLPRALEAWRCSNCGIRGSDSWPKTCPRTHLCGDAKLLPQIQWIIDTTSKRHAAARERAREAGAAYWPEGFPDV